MLFSTPLNLLPTSGEYGIRHFFFTRRCGGASSGPFEDFNMSLTKGDDHENVLKNRSLALEKLQTTDRPLLIPSQVHGADVLVVDSPWAPDAPLPEVDGLITTSSEVVVGVITADCGPLLLGDPTRGIVGAIHVGRRGALKGIVERAIEKMVTLGAKLENTVAALGPCIGSRNYEVGADVYEEFMDQSIANQVFFEKSGREGHHYFDLKTYIRNRLEKSGLTLIDIFPHDTYEHEEDFFSFRRATHRGERTYGAQLSAITLDKPTP